MKKPVEFKSVLEAFTASQQLEIREAWSICHHVQATPLNMVVLPTDGSPQFYCVPVGEEPLCWARYFVQGYVVQQDVRKGLILLRPDAGLELPANPLATAFMRKHNARFNSQGKTLAGTAIVVGLGGFYWRSVPYEFAIELAAT